MRNMPTYDQLNHKNEQLQREVTEYIRKENEFKKQMKLVEHRHIRRTLLLMKINDELNREISKLKTADKENLEFLSNKLRERVKELSCLYDISSLQDGTNFSIDDTLQAVVDFIPPTIELAENICARIISDNNHEIRTKNFQDTKWKLSQEIKINNKRVGLLEVCHLKQEFELENGPFSGEAKSLIHAVAESIAQIIEHARLELEIDKSRDKIENLIRQK